MAENGNAPLLESLEKGELDVAGADRLRAEACLDSDLKKAVEAALDPATEELASTRSPDRKKELGRARAVMLWALRRDAEAVEAFEDVQLDPLTSRLFARALVVVGRYGDASKQLAKKTVEQADPLGVGIECVEVERLQGEHDTASKRLTSLRKAHGDSAMLLCETGHCLEGAGDYAEAMAEYEKAIEADPACAAAAFRLAFLQGLRGDEEQAIRNYRRCTHGGNFYADALINLGILYEDRGAYHEAHRCFLSVLNAYPQNARAAMYLRDVEASFHMKIDEDFLRRPDARMRLLETPISEFELSARSRNCLESMGIASLGDLVSKSEQELMDHRNFGDTSLAEVKQLVRSKGLELGQVVPRFAADAGPARLPGADADVLDKPLSELDMSARSRKCIDTLHLQSLGDLADKSEKDLLQCRNVGVTTVEELKKKLAIFNLALRKDS